MIDPILKLEKIVKSYSHSASDIKILDNISLSLNKGDSISISGKSGCGKSTLLNIAALIDAPTSGNILFNGKSISSDKEKSMLRREKMGFIFQNSMLLEDFTAEENIMFPLNLNKIEKSKEKCEAILERLGLIDRRNHKPYELSGGERQRIAIARAIVHKPDIIFLDEPTGSLDEETSAGIEDLIISLVKEDNLSLILVTHNPLFAAKCEKRYLLTNKELTLL